MQAPIPKASISVIAPNQPLPGEPRVYGMVFMPNTAPQIVVDSTHLAMMAGFDLDSVLHATKANMAAAGFAVADWKLTHHASLGLYQSIASLGMELSVNFGNAPQVKEPEVQEPDCGVKDPNIHCRMLRCKSCNGKVWKEDTKQKSVETLISSVRFVFENASAEEKKMAERVIESFKKSHV